MNGDQRCKYHNYLLYDIHFESFLFLNRMLTYFYRTLQRHRLIQVKIETTICREDKYKFLNFGTLNLG